ncbi:MAG: hypothetical protein AAGA55_01020 [Planctomycetota bacterium]
MNHAIRLAVLLLFAAALSGCTSSGATREPIEATDITNGSNHTVRVSLHAGARVRLDGRPIQPLTDGRPLELARGETESIRIRRPRGTFLVNKRKDDELVYWLRAEIITPSWDEDAVFWFELLGPPAEQITITNASLTGGTAGLAASSPSVPVKPLAVDLYPFRDRNFAFELPDDN